MELAQTGTDQISGATVRANGDKPPIGIFITLLWSDRQESESNSGAIFSPSNGPNSELTALKAAPALVDFTQRQTYNTDHRLSSGKFLSIMFQYNGK